jgi:hypothetical protein
MARTGQSQAAGAPIGGEIITRVMANKPENLPGF